MPYLGPEVKSVHFHVSKAHAVDDDGLEERHAVGGVDLIEEDQDLWPSAIRLKSKSPHITSVPNWSRGAPRSGSAFCFWMASSRKDAMLAWTSPESVIPAI